MINMSPEVTSKIPNRAIVDANSRSTTENAVYSRTHAKKLMSNELPKGEG